MHPAAVACKWCYANQLGNFPSPKSAQFWKLCNQRTARNWSHSGHTDQELFLWPPERVLLDAFVHFIIYALQLLIQPADMSFDALLEDGRLDPGRSEERRVGKECRSRWSRYH